VRLLTLLEFVVRRQLKQNQEQLVGLIENNPKKGIDNPTTERLSRCFDDITLTIVHLPSHIIRTSRLDHLAATDPGNYSACRRACIPNWRRIEQS